jgi:DNA-binding PadR family transcriptional regulator
MMSLKHAILAVLSDKPRSGYEIAKKFSGSVGFFWSASHQQIYRDLAHLEEDGLVKFREVAQDKNPAKKIFSLTRTGTLHLKKWILEPTDLPSAKDELMVKVFCAHVVGIEPLKKELERLKKIHFEKWNTYQEIENEHFSKPQLLSEPLKFQYLTLQRGLIYEKGWLEWCEKALKLLT